MKKNKKKIILFVLVSMTFCCLFLLYPKNDARAQGEPSMWDMINGNTYYDPTTGKTTTAEEKAKELDQMYPPSGTSTYFNQELIPGAGKTSNFVDYIKQIIRFGFAAIGILALWMLSVGAYQYLMAASNLAKMENARETISSALLGLVLGLTAFLILRTINPQLVNLQLTSPGGVVGTLPGTTTIPKFSGAAPEEIKKKVQEYAGKYGIDEDLALRLVNAESNFDPNATSPKGAQGLMQLMPGTASGLGVNNSYDIDQNLNGGMRYFKGLLDKYGGNTEIALAAYNWGPDKVDKNGIDNLPKETKDFLCKILRKC